MTKRIFLLVADSFGIGAMPDADAYGDSGANTLSSIRKSPLLHIPCLESLGLLSIDGVSPSSDCTPIGVYGRLTEKSKGKDTVTGHWEMTGIISEKPFPLYPNGFPKEVLDAFRKITGRDVLCNLPYSGTKVLEDYGEEHLRTGNLIVYTSGDSVFQVAAHTSIVPEALLHDYCAQMRAALQGEHAVGRVIARPFEGEYPFHRTAGRHDYPLPPPQKTVLDRLKDSGMDVLAVGKIGDIFSMQGITERFPTQNNTHGLAVTKELAERDFTGLCFVNLVDFDMLYGHRRDRDGYAGAMTELDGFLSDFLPAMREDDLLILTGDHGCDPCHSGTDHTREYVPFLLYGKDITPRNIGTKDSFTFIADFIEDAFHLKEENL